MTVFAAILMIAYRDHIIRHGGMRAMPSMFSRALTIMTAFTNSGQLLKVVLRCISSALAPVTTGAAKLVPDPIAPTSCG